MQERQQGRLGRPRCSSDSFLRGGALVEELRRGHDQMCIRRAEAVKQRGCVSAERGGRPIQRTSGRLILVFV